MIIIEEQGIRPDFFPIEDVEQAHPPRLAATLPEIPDYSQDDFFNSLAPYEMVYRYREDTFLHERVLSTVCTKAAAVGIRNFKKLYAEYTKSLKQKSTEIYVNNSTDFEGQPLSLEAGDWQCDDFGIMRHNGAFEEQACCHPIMPVERLVNIDTGVEKLKIAYSKGRKWREVIADRRTLASNNSIISLADMGIAVTSENSKALVRYLHDIENLNYDRIPERKSVSRLGHIEDEGFSPYVDGLIFDGDANFRAIFESIKQRGSRDKWLSLARQVRQSNVMARIVLAASFASVLVKPCGGLPFFVHLWGGESGTGKTVALMLAASVWGNPEMGRYIQTFNSTVVGREKLASFLNHLPLLVDELQLARDARGKVTFDVYALAEGVGRTRGTKSGGIDRTPTWANCIITTGETPITGAGSGAGALNRVIEIECTSSNKVIDDGHGVAAELKRNYGFAGREFVERLYADGSAEKMQEMHKVALKTLQDSDATDKQAMAAATIIVADFLATKWIFQDDCALTVDDISAFLKSNAAISSGERGYRYMCDWVSQNANKLRKGVDQGDVYGVMDGNWVYVINSVWRRAAEDGGFSSAALLSWLKEKGLIKGRDKNNTRGKRIGGVLTECVCMRMQDIEEDVGTMSDADWEQLKV